MITHGQCPSRFWRSALIVSQVMVAGGLLWSWAARRSAGLGGGWGLAVDIPVGVAWVFLFLVSPFLVASQGKLAIAGWCLGFGALIWGALSIA